MKKLNKKQIAALFTALAVTGVAANAQEYITNGGVANTALAGDNVIVDNDGTNSDLGFTIGNGAGETSTADLDILITGDLLVGGQEVALSTDVSVDISTASSIAASADASLESALSTEVSTLASADASLESALSTEVSTLADADASLESALSTEVSTLADADASLESALSTEVSTLADADASLESALSTEVSTLAAADVSLESALSTEVSTLAAADVSLETAISNIESINAQVSNNASVALSTAQSTAEIIRREGGEGGNLIHIGENSLIIDDTLVGSLELSATDSLGDPTVINVVGSADDVLQVNGSTVRTTATDSLSKTETYNELMNVGLSGDLPSEVSSAVSQVETWQSYLVAAVPSFEASSASEYADWSTAGVILDEAISNALSYGAEGSTALAQDQYDLINGTNIGGNNGGLTNLSQDVTDEFLGYVDASVAEANNNTKINLFEALINGEISQAQSLAQSAADYLAEIAETYSLPTTAGGTGIQGVIDSVDSVASGDNSGNIADISSAIDTFSGIGGNVNAADGADAFDSTLIEVGALTDAIANALDGMPMISDEDKNDVLDLVVNGGWERQAIQENTDAIASQSLSLAAEVSNRLSADAVLSTAISSEESSRIAGDASLSTAVSSEESSRIAGDASLSTAISSEESSRIAGDQSLSSAVSLETSNRVVGDLSLSSAVSLETSNRVVGDLSLSSAVSLETSNRVVADVSLSSAISLETSNRVVADVSLSSAISLEASSRVVADVSLSSAVSLEASSRILADSSLSTAVSAEVSVRTSQVASLVTAISSEATARIAADTSLSSKIDAEVTRAKAAESALSSRISANTVEINKLRRGVAMAAALQTPVIAQGKDNAVKVGVAYFDGETGLAAGYARRISDSLQVNVEVATNSKFDETIARGGVNYSW